mmetsp:Transcript_1251/g.2658  ORF Transcript_1251/g.2658 Transcript_1251/m.2658 type:complete len:168 (+) Transcript_1251:80-583(+)
MEPALAEPQAKRAKPCDETQRIMVRMREEADDLVSNCGVCLEEDDPVLLLKINNPLALHTALAFAGSPVLPAAAGPDQSVADFMQWFSDKADEVKPGCCKAYPRDTTTRYCDCLTGDQAIQIAAKLGALYVWMNLVTTTPATQNVATLCKIDGTDGGSNLLQWPGIF